jgi:hypothetical protein
MVLLKRGNRKSIYLTKFYIQTKRYPTIREEITKFSVKYRDTITTLPNELASTLPAEEKSIRLNRLKLTDLTSRCS